MNYFGRLLSGVRAYYRELNPATLTGSIDVIVIEQPNGDWVCSPFHVRFGKLGVLRSREKVVDISINDEDVDIHMKLGDSGEAFFVERVPNSEPEIPIHLCTSPLPSTTLGRSRPPGFTFPDGERNVSESTASSFPGENDMSLTGDETSGPVGVDGGDLSSHSPPRSERRTYVRSLSDPDLHLLESTQKLRCHEELTEDWQAVLPPDSLLEGPSSGPSQSVTPKEPPSPQRRRLMKKGGALADSRQRPIIEEDSSHVESYDELDLLPGGAQLRRKRMRRKVRDMGRRTPKRTFSWHAGLCGADGMLPGAFRLTDRKQKSATAAQAENAEKTLTRPAGDDIFQLEVSDNEEGSNSGQGGSSSDTSQSAFSPLSSSVPANPGLKRPSFVGAWKSASEDVQVVTAKSLDAPTTGVPPDCLLSVLAPNIHPYSDTDLSPDSSPRGAVSHFAKSDTELDRVHKQDDLLKTPTQDSVSGGHWNWGELPTPAAERPPLLPPLTSPSQALAVEGAVVEVSQSREATSAPTVPLSDAQATAESSSGWGFGSLLGFRKRSRREDIEGVYLEDLVNDPEKAAQYLSNSLQRSHNMAEVTGGSASAIDVIASGRKPERLDSTSDAGSCSEPHSPKSTDGGYSSKPASLPGDVQRLSGPGGYLSLSLCGSGGKPFDQIHQDDFEAHLITFDEFSLNPDLIYDPKLIIKIGNRCYNWKVAAPVLLSLVVFQQPLNERTINRLVELHMTPSSPSTPVAPSKPSPGFPATKPLGITPTINTPPATSTTAASPASVSSWFSWRRAASMEPPARAIANGDLSPKIIVERETPVTMTTAKGVESANLNTTPVQPVTTPNMPMATYGELAEMYESDGELEFDTRRFRKTLRLSSKYLKKLKLRPGRNEARFSVTTKYQGTSWCVCDIYLWRHDDKIIISDIDGTITKSDVLGHLAPWVGGQWAQPGVTKLFNRIHNNGYRIVYLSARAIGQSYQTKEYLRSVNLDGYPLPDGPVLLNPTSLLTALHKEVIEKKPEEFKKSCLGDLRSLFPQQHKPLVAGFGNRINDVWAYRAVGIPTSRIFSINHRGELRYEFSTTFFSTYSHVAKDLVDHIFPPLTRRTGKSVQETRFDYCEEYSPFTYWKAPVMEIEPQMMDLLSPTPPTGGPYPLLKAQSLPAPDISPRERSEPPELSKPDGSGSSPGRKLSS